MSTIAELRRLGAERGDRLRVPAGDLVGKWVYHQGGVSAAVTKAFCQAQRGGRVLELCPTARLTGAPFLVPLSALRIVLVQTRDEEVESQGVDPRTADERRMDHLAALYRARHLGGFVDRLPLPYLQPDLRRVLDEVIKAEGMA